ncbi:MAG: M23 family metallopeptidase [Rhizobiaceae bacterium]
MGGAARIPGIAFLVLMAGLSRTAAGEFAFPANCTIGDNCFIQMMPDMDPGRRATDPFCGSATRDGYPGTDIRLMSMAEVARGVEVFAMSAGTVIEARDGLAGKIVRSKQDAENVFGRECGNGAAIDHGNATVAYYCHMRRESVAVAAGDTVVKGQKIGEIGASGMAYYPGLHVAVTRNGNIVDPVSGRLSGEPCSTTADAGKSYFSGTKLRGAKFGDTEFLGSGLTGANVAAGRLSKLGPPEKITAQSARMIAWSWLVNIRRGDRVQLRLFGPAGGIVAAKTTLPAIKPQAELAIYAGRNGRPAPGRYRIVVDLLRDGKPVKTEEKSIVIAG